MPDSANTDLDVLVIGEVLVEISSREPLGGTGHVPTLEQIRAHRAAHLATAGLATQGASS